MNNIRAVLAVYLPLTILILIFRALYQNGDPALYLMFAVRVSMLLGVILIRKRYREQRILVWAFLMTVLSDYFLVFARTFDQPLDDRELYGMMGFILAYIVLVAAFNRNFRFGRAEALTLLPFLIVFTGVFLSLRPYAEGAMLVAAIVIGVVLCFTGMTMVATLFRGYFSRRAALLIAAAGCLMFLSDMFVAYSIFHPAFREFILWKENLIWATYVPAWALLMLVAGEEKLHADRGKVKEAY